MVLPEKNWTPLLLSLHNFRLSGGCEILHASWEWAQRPDATAYTGIRTSADPRPVLQLLELTKAGVPRKAAGLRLTVMFVAVLRSTEKSVTFQKGYRMDQHPSARSCSSRGAAPSCESVSGEPPMNLYIHSTTGTRFELSLPAEETVEGLKRRLSQRLKVPKERLALLHKETRLSSGKLQDLGITDGSKLTLVPTVEAGLMSQASRPEQSVMQALESLTETQVSDFLSGRSPLTLALRVGDHMMFVQLQLAAQHSGGPQLQHRHLISRGSSEGTTGQSHPASGSASGMARVSHNPHPHHPHPHHPNTTLPSNPAAFLPSPSIPSVPPMYPTSASGHCSPPPHPSQLPGSFLHSQQPSSACPTSPSSPSPAAPCPELTTGPYLAQANCPAKTSGNCNTPSRSRKPGAIIESFVNHAPGVFSGTFSGTLHPNCQDSTGRPRRDIGTILQILNDLLSATRHYQGMPPSLTQLRYQTQCTSPSSPTPSPPPSPPYTPGLSSLPTTVPSEPQPTLHPLVQCQSQIRMCKPPGKEWGWTTLLPRGKRQRARAREITKRDSTHRRVAAPVGMHRRADRLQGDRLRQTENRATRCKVERLQLLMQQKRLRRKARRDSRAPYHWLPNRKAGRSNSNSSMSSEGSLDLDFEDSVWKPDVKADMKSEFIMA
ncbi:midnolin isoform X3 [Onychostoma macrolepis]|uniref:midnolin isoform X3 n=1 Tax=Onychostoma macrolepis TaxID=369639 RepID=UPI00272A80D2|nr:midnolin isoform X3 [Onychostoma macrolepis]